MPRIFLSALLLSLCLGSALAHPGADDVFPPRVRAALDQGRAAEKGVGMKRNVSAALALYCDAGAMGSAEGFYRIGRVLSGGPPGYRDKPTANAFFALAIRLGHHDALKYYDERVKNAEIGDECGVFRGRMLTERFDLGRYLAGQPAQKRRIAAYIREMAPKYAVDVRVALAVALAESNLDHRAVSPKNAQGVMQIIPDTQKRFGVRDPFDPKHNVRGGLAYLKWLGERYKGDPRLIAAAYNAGEGAVDRYGGVPPFAETQQYVQRVLYFAGFKR